MSKLPTPKEIANTVRKQLESAGAVLHTKKDGPMSPADTDRVVRAIANNVAQLLVLHEVDRELDEGVLNIDRKFHSNDD